MANYLKGEVELEAGGEKLIFRLGINEMIGLQNALGLADDDEKFLIEINNLVGFRKPRLVAFWGLKLRQPDITEDRAGDIVTEIGMAKFSLIYQQAIRWALPDKEPADEKGGEPRPFGGPTPS